MGIDHLVRVVAQFESIFRLCDLRGLVQAPLITVES